MGVIPVRQRQRLVSSVVGTPGVSTAGAALGQAVAGFGAGLATGLFKDLAVQRAAKQERTQKIQDVSDSMDADNRLLTLQTQSRALNGQMVADKKSAQEHLEAQTALKKSVLTGDESLGFLKRFAAGSRNILAESADEFETNTTARNLRSIGTTANQNFGILAENVSDGFAAPPEEADELAQITLLGKATREGRAILAKLEATMGAKAFNTFVADNDKILVEAAVNSLIENDPASVNAFLDSIAAETLTGKQLSDEEKTEIRKEASDFLTKKKKVREETLRRSEAEAEGEVMDNIAAGELPTMTELALMELRSGKGGPSKSFIEVVRKLKKSLAPKKFGSNSRTFFEINKMFDNLITAKKADIKEKTPTEQFLLERVSVLRQNILEAKASGELSDKEASPFERIVGSEFTKRTTRVVERMRLLNTAKGWVAGTPNLLFTDPQELEQATMEFQVDLMNAINTAEDEGPRLTHKAAQKLAAQVKEDFVIRHSTNRGKFEIGDIIPMLGSNWEVRGYDSAGEPMLREVDASTKQEKPKE